MKKNFRFFDNRQKYLLFVTTTNEKNKIADALKPIVQKLKPKLNLVANYEGFSTKPLDDVNKKELKIIQNMKTQFDANLSAYSRQYRSFMSNLLVSISLNLE